MNAADLEGLPGAELITQGFADLARGEISECSLLLLVAEPRLKGLGFEIDTTRLPVSPPFTYALYDFIENRCAEGAHSRYNSLLRRMASLAHALEREQSRASAEAAAAPTTPSS